MPGPKSPLRDRSASTWKQPLTAGLAFAFATYCSLPPLGLWPFTFVAALALIWCACRVGAAKSRRLRSAVVFGAATLPLWFAEEVWMVNVTPVGYPLLALWLGFWGGVTVYAIATVRSTGWKLPMAVAAPLVWVAVEMLRGEVVLTGYPWYFAAHPLIKEPALCLPARVLGVYFVSALVVALAGSLADAAGWSAVRARVGGMCAATIAAVWVGVSLVGLAGTGPDRPRRELRVGIVQTNVPQGQKLNWPPAQQAADFGRFMELTRAVGTVAPVPDLILWPETMFPGWALNGEAIEAARKFADSVGEKPQSFLRAYGYGFAEALCREQAELGVPMLIGAQAREGVGESRLANGKGTLIEERRYNSVAIVAGGRVLDERYDKVDLTPFGEVIPWVWRWPSVQKLVLDLGAGGMRFDLNFGRRPAPIDVPLVEGGGLRVAAPVCFEATWTTSCRRLVRGVPDGRPAELMVNLSNDGWFGSEAWWLVSSDAKRRQHLLSARWRCLELGVPMVRAVNTGLSAYIDDRGRTRPYETVLGSRKPAQADGALLGSVEVGGRGTIYSSIGNLAGWVLLGCGLVLFLTACVTRPKS